MISPWAVSKLGRGGGSVALYVSIQFVPVVDDICALLNIMPLLRRYLSSMRCFASCFLSV